LSGKIADDIKRDCFIYDEQVMLKIKVTIMKTTMLAIIVANGNIMKYYEM